MKKVKLLVLAIILMLVAGYILLKPVPILPEEELLVLEGQVENVFETSDLDIVFQLADSDLVFYINRGVEHGLSIEKLQRELIGRKVTFKYPEYQSFFSGKRIKHVSIVRLKAKTIFSESPESGPRVLI